MPGIGEYISDAALTDSKLLKIKLLSCLGYNQYLLLKVSV